MLGVPQLSDAVAAKVTTASQTPAAAFTLIFDGQAITGTSLSETVTVNEQVATFPFPSAAVAVTVLVPIGNAVPEAGL